MSLLDLNTVETTVRSKHNYGSNGPGVRRALRRSAAANTHRLHKITLLTKLVLPPTLFPNSVGADTDY